MAVVELPSSSIPPRPRVSPSYYASVPSTTVNLRVNKVLSSTFEDAGTRAALHILASLSSDVEGVKGRDGAGLSWLQKGGLRREVERRIAERSREFLGIFSEVNERLTELQKHLDAMHAQCDLVQSNLDSASSATTHLLAHASTLRQESASTQTKHLLSTLFLHRFILTPSETQALTSRDSPVSPAFFAALDRLSSIRSSCAALLASPELTAGLAIMDSTSLLFEKGYDKLFRWCAFEARATLGKSGEAQIEVSGLMREAIARLGQARPELLDEVLSQLATTRSASLLSIFIVALTRGPPRPIELHAHDPIRYVGDMLAWVHQAMAGEHEFLESLFGLNTDGRRVGEVRVFSPLVAVTEKGERVMGNRERVRRMLDRDMEGCARPLRMRIGQTVKSQEGPIIAYQIATLIHFYKITMERTIGEDALLSKTMAEITADAYAAFHFTLATATRSLLPFPQPPADLSPPPALKDHLSSLREIMAVYDSSLAEDDAPTLPAESPEEEQKRKVMMEEKREDGFAEVLESGVGPTVKMCEAVAGLRQVEWERGVFMVNCLGLIISTLEPFDFTRKRRAALQAMLDSHVSSLTADHFYSLLTDSGLLPIIEALDSHPSDDNTPLSHLDPASPRNLTIAVQTFDVFLADLDPMSSPRLALLSSAKLAGEIHRMAVKRVGEAYDRVWDAVMDEKNRYEFGSTVLVRSKEEVRTLTA